MRVLLDTGPWAALIDRSEERQSGCLGWFETFQGEIYASEVERYHDTPTDYADATLVCLAENLEIREIVPFDKRDYHIFRLPSGRPFHILPCPNKDF